MIKTFIRSSRALLRWHASGTADADAATAGLKQNMPLVPSGSIAGRALITVIAIMTFLATFVTGIGVLMHSASRDWTENIAREMTIQVRPSPSKDIDAEVARAAQVARGAPGVAAVRIFDKSESQKLLEPWLGAGLDLGELPIPRLIVLELGGGASLDAQKLAQALREQAPTASLDDHRLWLERLAAMARSLVVIIAVILTLVLIAMGTAIGFATRGAMSGNRDIVDVLHYVGAADQFIAREFQRHFLRLGLRGATIGAATAIAVFMIFGTASNWWAGGASGDQIEALFGTFALNPGGYAAIALIGVGIALLTGAVSRIIVFRHLRGLD